MLWSVRRTIGVLAVVVVPRTVRFRLTPPTPKVGMLQLRLVVRLRSRSSATRVTGLSSD